TNPSSTGVASTTTGTSASTTTAIEPTTTTARPNDEPAQGSPAVGGKEIRSPSLIRRDRAIFVPDNDRVVVAGWPAVPRVLTRHRKPRCDYERARRISV